VTRSTDTGAQQSRWLLYRIDDNGNEVVMHRFASRADAEAAMREYEARGHKQAYLVREERGTPAP
jgi:hypothetical protein